MADRPAAEARRALGGTWLAFLLAAALALPQPPRPSALALAALAGALLVGAGFWFVSRCRPLAPRSTGEPPSLAALSLAAGAGLGLLLLGVLSRLVSLVPALQSRFAGRLDEPAWRPWALGLESSILEEVVFRLFALGLIAWLAMRFGARRAVAFGVALTVSTLLFGAVHLPAWLAAAPASAGLIAGVLALNGAGGLLFGWIFWRWGLPYAILCHFAGDVVVQTLGPRWLG